LDVLAEEQVYSLATQLVFLAVVPGHRRDATFRQVSRPIPCDRHCMPGLGLKGIAGNPSLGNRRIEAPLAAREMTIPTFEMMIPTCSDDLQSAHIDLFFSSAAQQAVPRMKTDGASAGVSPHH